jgi:hypothetical protein
MRVLDRVGDFKTHDVRARARADAAAGLPAPEAASLSPLEREIADAHAHERMRMEAQRSAKARETEVDMQRRQPAPPDLAGPVASARLAFARIEGRAAPECAAALERAARAKEDLERFRHSNRLHREAVYPESTLFQAGLLLCAALFEALFSATLFAQEAEQGLLGGAAIAIGLSAANVTLGFLAGFLGLRYLQPMRLWPRLLGGTAFAAFAVLAGSLNWFAAQWRETLASAAREIDPFAPALDLLGFAEPQAVVLLMLGAGVWVFSALKGYSGFDDPHPDYGKMHRAHERAAADLAGLRADVREGLEENVENASAAIETELEDMRKAARAMRAAYDEAAVAVGAVDANLRKTDEKAAALIELYRRENRAARTTPPPAYFSEPPLIAGAPDDVLERCGRYISEAQQTLAAAQAAGSEALRALASDMEAVSMRLDGRAEP